MVIYENTGLASMTKSLLSTTTCGVVSGTRMPTSKAFALSGISSRPCAGNTKRARNCSTKSLSVGSWPPTSPKTIKTRPVRLLHSAIRPFGPERRGNSPSIRSSKAPAVKMRVADDERTALSGGECADFLAPPLASRPVTTLMR